MPQLTKYKADVCFLFGCITHVQFPPYTLTYGLSGSFPDTCVLVQSVLICPMAVRQTVLYHHQVSENLYCRCTWIVNVFFKVFCMQIFVRRCCVLRIVWIKVFYRLEHLYSPRWSHYCASKQNLVTSHIGTWVLNIDVKVWEKYTKKTLKRGKLKKRFKSNKKS